MNIIHPLPPHLYTIEEHSKDNPPQPYYDDPPPPYESPLPSIKVELVNSLISFLFFNLLKYSR